MLRVTPDADLRLRLLRANPMSISRYVVVCRHVSPRLLGLTAAPRVRQSLVVDIVPGLTETVDTLTVSTLVAAIRAETAYSRQSPVDRPKDCPGRLEGGACTGRPASPLGSQLKCDGGGTLRGPRHPPLVSGRVPEVVDVPIDRTRLVHPERGQKDDAVGEVDPGGLCSHALPPPP